MRRAKADPGFRARLLKNANQAIKDEFGEELPYKLKCKEKLSFEIEAMDEMSDADAKSVAGGGGEGEFQDFAPAPLLSHHFKTENVCLAPAPPVMNDCDLENVAGGGSYNADYEFSSRPALPTLGRANGRLGAKPYPKAFPPSFRKSRWRSVYHPGNYDDFLVESQQYLRSKNNSGLNFR